MTEKNEHLSESELIARLGALPRDLDPPPEALAGIRARLDALHAAQVTPAAHAGGSGDRGRGTVPQEQFAADGINTPRPWWARRSTLAAAAMLLVALSSAATAALMLRYGPQRSAADAAPVMARSSTQLVTLTIMESSYAATIDELQRILDEHQHVLAPETVRLLEANLAVIDRALAEARAALHDDPADAMLVDLLRANYERKIDVLRSASQYVVTRL